MLTLQQKKEAGRARVVLYLSCTPPVQCRVRNRLAGWKVHCKLSCLFLLLNLSDIWLTLLWTQPPRPPSSHPSPAGSCQPKTPPLIPFSLTLLNRAGAGTQGPAQRKPLHWRDNNYLCSKLQQASSSAANRKVLQSATLPDTVFKLISFSQGWMAPTLHPHLCCTLLLFQGCGTS